MNYLEIIQSVAKIKLGESPSLFSETTGDDYYKITEEINNALEDFFLNDGYNFRRKDTTFPMVVSQQNYTHSYGVILKDGLYLTNSDGDNSKLYWVDDFQNLKYQDTDTDGIPLYWTIYNDEILFYPTPDDTYTVNVAYITDYWAKNASGTEKRILELEDDEPNFPEKYHTILKYKTLMELYYGDPAREQKYRRLYLNKLSQITRESTGTQEKSEVVIMNNVNF